MEEVNLYLTPIVTTIAVVLIAQGLLTNCYGLLSNKNPDSQQLPTRHIQLHVKRKIQHVATGLVFIAIDMSNLLTPHIAALVLFCCALLFLLFVHVVPRQLFVDIFKDILRKEEAEGKVYPASLWFLMGFAGAISLLPNHPDIYRIALLHLALGDPAAGICGGLYGKTNVGVGKKTIEGCIGCFVVCAIVTGLYLWGTNNTVSDRWVLCLMGGLVGSLAELIPTPLDDNFSLPIFSALGLWVLNEYCFHFSRIRE